MKKILLIGNTTSGSALRLKSEATKLGLVFDLVSPEDVYCDEYGQPLTSTVLKDAIYEYDVYFFRGIGARMKLLESFINALQQKGKRIVEKCLVDKSSFPEDKFVPASTTGIYKFPETRVLASAHFLEAVTTMSWPLVLKKIGPGSSMGKGVVLANDAATAKAFVFGYKGLIQIQQQHSFEYDTRVLVVGDNCVGGFNRFRKDGAFLTTRKGGPREVANLNQVQIKAALEAATLHGLEIAGVDMFYDQNQLYIIEVNSSPQFNVFEKITSINVAKLILSYLIR